MLGGGFSASPRELMQLQPSQQPFKAMPGSQMHMQMHMQAQGAPLANIGNGMQLMGSGGRGQMPGQMALQGQGQGVGQMGQGSLRNTLGLPAGTRGGGGQHLGSKLHSPITTHYADFVGAQRKKCT